MNTKSKKVVMCERAQGSHEIVMCAGCKGFYSRRRISEHKKTCTSKTSLSSGFIRLSPVSPSAIHVKSESLGQTERQQEGICHGQMKIHKK